MSTPYSAPVDPRVSELLTWSAETGRPLPLPLATIIEFEDAGCIVDLDGDGTVYSSEQAWLAHLAALADEAVHDAQ